MHKRMLPLRLFFFVIAFMTASFEWMYINVMHIWIVCRFE